MSRKDWTVNVLVTGATGFVGSHLVRKLVQEGMDVSALVRSTSRLDRISDLVGKLRLVPIDAPDFWTELSGASVDALIHVATDYGRGDVSAASLVEANVVFPLRLYEVVHKSNPVFINTDTFFSKPELRNERLPEYTKTKQQLLDWLTLLGARGARIVNLRLEHVFGPGDSAGKFVPATLDRLMRHEGPIPLSDGAQKRDFVYVGDVVEAYLSILKSAAMVGPGVVEHQAGRGEAIAVRRFVELLKEGAGSRSVLNFGAIPTAPGEIEQSQADIRSLLKLGWRPATALTQGIAKCIERKTNGP